jgi:hypothetical protein
MIARVLRHVALCAWLALPTPGAHAEDSPDGVATQAAGDVQAILDCAPCIECLNCYSAPGPRAILPPLVQGDAAAARPWGIRPPPARGVIAEIHVETQPARVPMRIAPCRWLD